MKKGHRAQSNHTTLLALGWSPKSIPLWDKSFNTAHLRCFSETRLSFASNINLFHFSIKQAYCIFVTDSHYSAYRQNEGDSYLSSYLLGLISFLTWLLQNCQQPVGGRCVIWGGTGPTSESLRKKRAGNVVTGQQQQQFSYYSISMAAGEEQQHNNTVALQWAWTAHTDTHTYTYRLDLHTDEDRNTYHKIGHLSTYIYRHRPPIFNKYGMYNLLDLIYNPNFKKVGTLCNIQTQPDFDGLQII